MFIRELYYIQNKISEIYARRFSETSNAKNIVLRAFCT